MTALCLTVLLFAALLGPQHDDLVVREAHHGYYGIVLAGFGYGFRLPWLYWVGTMILADDALQHALQRWVAGPTFRSPLRRLYGFAYRFSVVRRANAWLDELLR